VILHEAEEGNIDCKDDSKCSKWECPPPDCQQEQADKNDGLNHNTHHPQGLIREWVLRKSGSWPESDKGTGKLCYECDRRQGVCEGDYRGEEMHNPWRVAV